MEAVERAALKLDPNERLRLIESLWESLRRDPDADFPVSAETRALLDERLSKHASNPEQTLSWDEVKARVGVDAVAAGLG